MEPSLTEPGLTVLNPAEETMVVALGVIRCFRLIIACMLCTVDPISDAFFIASLLATARHF